MILMAAQILHFKPKEWTRTRTPSLETKRPLLDTKRAEALEVRFAIDADAEALRVAIATRAEKGRASDVNMGHARTESTNEEKRERESTLQHIGKQNRFFSLYMPLL